MAEVCDYSDRRVRAAVAGMPDGRWTFADHLELDHPATIRCEVAIDGDEVAVDFAGTDPQVPLNVNAVLAVTTSSTWFVFRMLTDPAAPPNAGAYWACSVRAPAGTLVHAQPPAPVAAGNVETSQRIVDVLLGAFAQALPDRVPAASQGTMNNLLIGHSGAGGAPFSYYETIAGGEGATPFRDGISGVHTGMTNTRNTPAEAMELAYPLRVWRAELRRGSGGAGRHGGGDGVVREIEALAPATVTLQTERRATAPRGLHGGEDAQPGRNIRVAADGTETELSAKGTWQLSAGERVRIETPGGGGWGQA
ncbi:MAG TPA: hydantoinase B/oxoprolinase family protein [Egibacteraceae bacterium]|nr:hydantoinase B/oxoprolinase family protein [Egibacteraceae bacterium]